MATTSVPLCVGMMSPHDVAGCEQTSRLYVADWQCVWRVSADGADPRRWLPATPDDDDDKINPWTLSVTARTDVLVTLPDVRQLALYDSTGSELRRIRLPGHCVPRHAVLQAVSGTIVVSLANTQLDQDQVGLDLTIENCVGPLQGWPI